MGNKQLDTSREDVTPDSQLPASPNTPSVPLPDELMRTAALYERIFRDGPVSLAVVSASERRFLAANETFLRYIGFTWAELSGNAWKATDFLVDAQSVRRLTSALQELGSVRNMELQYRTRSGELRTALASVGFVEYMGETCIYVAGIDVTEEKTAKLALQERGAFLEALFDGLFAAVMVLERDDHGQYRWLDINQSASQFLGVKRQQAIGERLEDRLADRPQALAMLLEELDRAHELGQVVEREYAVLHGPEPRHFLSRISPIKNMSGVSRRFVAVSTDVTDLRMAKNDAREREAFLDAVFAGVPSGVLVLGLDAAGDPVVLDANDYATMLLNTSRGELAGKHVALSDLLPEEAASVFLSDIAQARETGEVVVREVLRFDESSLGWFLRRLVPLASAEGQPSLFVTSFTDITEQKLSKETALDREAFLSGIYENVENGIFVIEINADGELSYVDMNTNAAILTGHGREELLGRSVRELHAENRSVMQVTSEAIQRLLATGGVVEYEIQTRARHDARSLLVRISLLETDTGRRLLIGTTTDVTALRQAQEAERRQRVLADTLRGVAASLNSTLDLELLLGTILKELADLIGFRAATVMMLVDDCAHTVAFYGELPSHQGSMVFPLAQFEYIREVVESQKPVIISDTRDDSRWLALNQTPEIRSWMGVPLTRHGETIGLLSHVHTIEDHFSDQEAQLVSMFADHAALAIHNARLYEQAQKEVADRRQAENSLRVSETRYRSLVEDMPILVCRFLRDGTLTFVNNLYCDYFGMTKEQLLGKSFFDFLPPEEHEQTKNHIAGVDQDRPSTTYEHLVLDKNGQERWQRWTDRAIFNDQGEIVEYQSVGEDVTERRMTELAMETERTTLAQRVRERTIELQLQRDRQAALATIKPVIAKAEELEGLLTRIVQVTTEALPSSAGVNIVLWNSDDDSLRVAASTVSLGPGHRPAQRGRSSGVITRRIIQHLEPITLCSLDDDTYGVRGTLEQAGLQACLGVPLAAHGRALGALFAYSDRPHVYAADEIEFMMDVADRAALILANVHLYEDLRAANQDLARAVRTKDEFLASVSHELRTPLNGILGMAEALEDGLYGHVSKTQQRSLRTIQQSGQHLLSLIGDILDLATVESGGAALTLTFLDAGQLCNASVQLVTSSVQRKQQRLTVTLDQAVNTILADERRLKQILVNLLGNASKFTPVGGAIGLEMRGDRAAGTVRFEVWDTGIGVPEDQAERLFEPFVQLDSGLDRQYEGVGLGLALCSRMAELHGGSVRLMASEPGMGSRFLLEIPWHESPGSPDMTVQLGTGPLTVAPQPGNQAGPPEGPLILLGEDNAANVYSLGEYLTHKGYRIIVAEDGHEVLEKLVTHRPDLILMDIQMPGLDGVSAMQRIRQHEDPTLARTPIIAVTALARAWDEQRCRDAGANGYQAKPLRLRELVKEIESLIASD